MRPEISELQLRVQRSSPALTERAEGYPFGARVPRIVRLVPNNPDLLRDLGLPAGTEVPVWTNAFGAICAICPKGFLKGLPHEGVDVLEWF